LLPGRGFAGQTDIHASMIRDFSSISHGLESLQILAEFHFFFIWSFDREETDAIFPERKEMYFILRRIQTGPGNHFVNCESQFVGDFIRIRAA